MLQTGQASLRNSVNSIQNSARAPVAQPSQNVQVQPLQPSQQVPQVPLVIGATSQPQLAQNGNPNPLVVNNFNIVNSQTDKIVVEHNKDKSEFSFYNFNRQLIGSFNVLQLFKYLNNDIDTYLVGTHVGASEEVINKYIYNALKDVNNTCELISHIESPFTGNVELLIKLYADILKVEQELNNELLSKPVEIAEKIKEKRSRFIYNLLTRILKLSNTLIDKIDSTQDITTKEMKDTLIRYSVGSVYKLSQLIKEDVSIKSLQLDNVNTNIDKLLKIQQSMTEKIDKVKESIDTQNKSIDTLILQLTLNETKQAQKAQKAQKGGNKSSHSSSSSTSKSSKSSSTSTNTASESQDVTSSTAKHHDLSHNSSHNSSNNSSSNNMSDTSLTVKQSSKSTSSLSKSISKSASESESYSITNVTSQSAGHKKNKRIRKTIPKVISHLSDFSVTSITHNIKPLDNIVSHTDKTKSYIRSYNINSSINNNTNDSINITTMSD